MSTARRERRSDHGFTLVEVVIAVVLVAVVSTVAVVGVSRLAARGSGAACEASRDAARTGAQAHWATTGTQAATFSELTASGALIAPEATAITHDGLVLGTETWKLAITASPPEFHCTTAEHATVLDTLIAFDTSYRSLLTTEPALTSTARVTRALDALAPTVAVHAVDDITLEFSLSTACAALTLAADAAEPLTPRLALCEPPTAPQPPTNLASAARTPSTVTLTWSAPTDTGRRPVTDYIVDVAVGAGSYQRYEDGTGTATTVTITGLAGETLHNIRIAAVNVAGQSEWVTIAATPSNRPLNDHAADAAVIGPLEQMTTWTGTYVDGTHATAETGEDSTRRTMWWSYTPGFTGRARFGVEFTGTSLGHTTTTVRDAASPTATSLASCSTYGTTGSCFGPIITVTAGRTIWLQIAHPRNGTTTWDARPLIQTFTTLSPNDHLADAAVIPTQPTNTTWTGDAVAATSATTESGETALSFHLERTLWWAYTAGHTGPMTVTGTFTGTQTSWSVVTVRGERSLSAPVIANCYTTSTCVTPSFMATAGTTYYLQMSAGNDPTAGPLTIRPAIQTFSEYVAPAANDNLADAAAIPTQPPNTTWTGTTHEATFATKEPGETAHAWPSERSLWWTYTAGHTGPMTVTGTLTGTQTTWSLVTVRSTPSVSGSAIAFCVTLSACTTPAFTATAGTTYYIQITSGNTSTSGPLTIRPAIRTL